MKTISDAFIEISNSKESIDMIFNNYMAISQRTSKTTALAHKKLRNMIKENNKNTLQKKYQKISDNILFILIKLISEDYLKEVKDEKDIIEILKLQNDISLENLQKLCVAFIHFQEEIANYFQLIVDNHKKGLYLFEGIDAFSIDDKINNKDTILNIEVDNIKKSMLEMQMRLDCLTKDTEKLKQENNRLSNENKDMRREIRKKNKELERKDNEKSEINKELIKFKNSFNIKEKEVSSLQEQVENLNSTLKNTIDLDKLIVPNEVYQETCIIHTSPLYMVDKIHYDVRFINYKSISKEIKKLLRNLKLEGINKIGIQSNLIDSFTIQNLISSAQEENITMFRLFFNTEKELTEKLSKIK